MIIVAGIVKLAPGTFEALTTAMEAMLAASRAEPGCLAYTYAQDVLDPAIIRVFEQWDSEESLDAHFQTEHLQTWRAALADAQIVSRELQAYEVASARAV